VTEPVIRTTTVVEMLTKSLAETRDDIASANAAGNEWLSLMWRAREGAFIYALELLDPHGGHR